MGSDPVPVAHDRQVLAHPVLYQVFWGAGWDHPAPTPALVQGAEFERAQRPIRELIHEIDRNPDDPGLYERLAVFLSLRPNLPRDAPGHLAQPHAATARRSKSGILDFEPPSMTRPTP